MTQEEWLKNTLVESFVLTERVEEYLLSRGAQEGSYQEMGIKTWGEPQEEAPPGSFSKIYGSRGERIRGCLICPLYAPCGDLLGFEARRTTKKWVSDFRFMPRSRWLPVCLGMGKARKKLWTDAEFYFVEGLFDLFALEWVVPKGDIILGSLRAKLSYGHVSFLSRFATCVHMVYDEDEAGRKGARGALFDLQRVDVVCREVRYCGGKDPGEIWDNFGLEGLRKAFSF